MEARPRNDFREVADGYLAWCFAQRTSPQVNELAAILGLPTPKFSNLFLKAVGMRPSVYLKNAQIEEAKRLLRTTDMRVADVGPASGFPREATFYRAFRRATGMTPQQFRDKNS